MIRFHENAWTEKDGRKDTQTLFYWTLLTTVLYQTTLEDILDLRPQNSQKTFSPVTE